MARRERTTFNVGDKVLDGRYEVLKVIHTRGMSSVYLILDNNLNKQWCLKEVRKSDAGRDNIEYHALLQEANIMKGLNHPNIPRITTIEDYDDSLFIVMDYVDGMSVKNWLETKGKINQEVVVRWMKQVTYVMLYLHSRPQPIFYRDMKPDNIMIQSDGSVKLLDFGISIVIKEKGQRIEKALGTKGYAAPEQSKKGNVCDLRSDIYALGKTMYFMLTGLNPNQIPKEKLKPIRDIDSSISVGLEQIVEKCTKENPDERYQSCEELMYALQNYTTLDAKHHKKLKFKCNLILGLGVSSILTLMGSLIPYNLNIKTQENEYAMLKTVAEQSGKESDYLNALEVNPTDIGLYLGYIDTIKQDGIFSLEEESSLLGYLNVSLDELKQDDNYGNLAYNVGKLYWFYYVKTEEGMSTSIKWFKDSYAEDFEKESSNTFYQLGMFNKTITSAVMESADRGVYKTYWENLLKARSDTSNGELVSLQLNYAVASCISTYAYNLKNDGVSYEEVSKIISELQSYVDKYPTENISVEKVQDTYSKLKSSLGTLQSKVDTIYKGGAS